MLKSKTYQTPLSPLPKHIINAKYMDSLIKPYNDRRASFGRHETFSLRLVNKGFSSLYEKENHFLI